MRSLLLSFSFCLLLFVASSEALRLRGEQQPAQRAANSVRYASRLDASSPQGRVVGGSTVNIGEWPWMVSIQNQYGMDFCGGVVINETWILTAASCVSGLRARNVIAVTGTVDTYNFSSPYYLVDEIHIHCNFDKPLYHNDIALLHVNENIELNDETAIIPLNEIDELQEGEKLSFAGWGTPSADGTRSRYLLKSDGTYIDVEKCRSELGDTEDVDLGHVCVQMAAGKGTCHGDTGGPLINEQGELVGIGNWGVPCGLGYPDVYARVAFYSDWIRTIINGCGIA
ncbi:chymotrypsin-2 [Drosophila sulfurigaster albostrigata]|uniref:chymotrypsin-2 n=1 Tax=Drosophila sulfurigaster albostrigata TaxID=89887 RepID=UPI002D21AD39|nr:chymotrypsin-2 [Drosophila sulfurigaster albostrigata]